MKEKVKTHIEIDGAILSPDAISRLKELQEGDNDGIINYKEIIADSICLLTLLLDHYNHEPTKQKIVRNITDLSYLRNDFNDLKKP